MVFHLPSNVTAQRQPISATAFSYLLRHSEFGPLGLVLLEQNEAGYHVTPKLFAAPRADLTEKRRLAFEPIVQSLVSQFPKAELPGRAALYDAYRQIFI